MGKRTCSVEGCNKPHDSHGLCRSHCSRWKQHGDPLAGGKPRIVGDTVARFWSRVDKTGDCWVWTGQINSNGYGVLYAGNRMTLLTGSRMKCWLSQYRKVWDSIISVACVTA